MKESTQRTFIALDEWLGMIILIYLFEADSVLFWVMLPLWVVAVYGISYPFYWWGREDKQQPTPLQLALRRLRQLRHRGLLHE